MVILSNKDLFTERTISLKLIWKGFLQERMITDKGAETQAYQAWLLNDPTYEKVMSVKSNEGVDLSGVGHEQRATPSQALSPLPVSKAQ